MRFIKALRAEDLPLEKIQYVNGTVPPEAMDLTGKSRVKKLAESLSVEIKTLLPDGGKARAGGRRQRPATRRSRPQEPPVAQGNREAGAGPASGDEARDATAAK